MELPDRFWDKVMPEPNSGCWLWTGSVKPNGYGQFCWDTKTKIPRYAHRLSYQAHKGEIPDGMQIDHLCRIRCCVNPDHLEAVTHLENRSRGDNKNCGAHNSIKTHCPQGHEYTKENTRLTKGGSRSCKTCERVRALNHYHNVAKLRMKS